MPSLFRFLTPVALSLCLASTVGLAQTGEDTRIAPLRKLIQDPSPKVRLEALRAMAKIPTAESAALALSALDQPMDPTLDYALWLTINDLSEPWIAALQSGAWKPERHEKQLEFALRAIRPEQASRVLSQLLATKPLAKDGQGPWIELIGAAGSPKELRQVFDLVLAGRFDAPTSARALTALGEAARLRKVQPEGDLSSVTRLFTSDSEPVQVAALRLAGLWKQGTFVSPVAGVLSGLNLRPAIRDAALETLRQIGGPESLKALQGLVASSNPSMSRAAVASLAQLDLNAALPAIVALAQESSDETEALAFWRSVLGVKGAGKRIAEGLPKSGVPQLVARAGMRAAREGGRNDLDLVLALAQGSGLAGDSGSAAGSEVIRDLAARAMSKGDPHRGESLYRRKDLACMSCHAIGGVGARVGPDMTSIGASAPMDYLVESVLLPNAKIKEGYHSVVVATKDGTEYTGTLARETPQELVLRLASGAEQSVAKADIERREQGTLSIMPGGLLDPLNEQEQLDLFAFLSRLGKPGDFDAAQGGVARLWRVGQTVHTDAQAGQDVWPLTANWDDRRWSPAPALVKGVLPRDLINEITKASPWTSRLGVYAATELVTSKDGPVRLHLKAAPGAELWVDGRKVGGHGANTATLKAGTHRILVRMDPKQVPDELRLDSPDGAFVLN
ncbi:MAG: c-type cytochrome [Verrucomicrobia bacterium]|nr:c-type cytochrome [Verrucomicrobiota bacterium]